MNEVTQIHLGRQAFTIAAPAHVVLRKYIEAIQKRAGKDVAEEVELRIAELLTEAGFNAEKVVLESDIDAIKQNLGSPADFADEDEQADEPVDEDGSKRLYRDTENAWLGGVAAGIAAYLQLPVWVVRLVFIGLTFAWGSSILIYIILWLLIPEARTPSERLRMRGKPVTVETLKEFVESKELGTKTTEWAERVSDNFGRSTSGVGRVFRTIGRLFTSIVGIGWMAIGVASIMYILATGTYGLFNADRLYSGNVLFPVGAAEKWLLVLGMFIAILFMTLCFVAVGLALIRRKWPFPGWLTAVLIGVFLAGSALTAPMVVNTVYKVGDRYQAIERSETRQLTAFTSLSVDAPEAQVDFRPADHYYVELKTVGDYDLSKVSTQVVDGKLVVGAADYKDDRSCSSFCIDLDKLDITIYAPNPNTIPADGAKGTPINIYFWSLSPEPVIYSL